MMEKDEKSYFCLAENKNAKAAIIIGGNASVAQKHAAKELKKYLDIITSAEFPIFSEGDDTSSDYKYAILIGDGSTHGGIKKLIEDKQVILDSENPGLDGFVIKTVDSSLILGGSRDRGTIYAVYHLLEKYMNVGFFWDGDSIHSMDSVCLPEINIFERPAFEYRYSKSGSECNAIYNFTHWWEFKDWKNEIDWMMKNKINIGGIKCGEAYINKICYEKLNVEHEPINEYDIERMEIAKQIYDYCRMLDFNVSCAFHSMRVPWAFEKAYPDSKFYKANWNADTTEKTLDGPMPHFFPWDPVYKKLIATYISTWKEIYGGTHFHIAAIPCEADIDATEEDVRNIYALAPKEFDEAVRIADTDGIIIYDGWMMRYDSVHVWEMKGAIKDFMDNMPMERSMLLDLWPEWRLGIPLYKEKKYEYIKNKKFLLTFLNEFGGNDYLHGCYDTAINEVKELMTNRNAKNCVGVGNSTEVMYFNVNYYDLMFRLAWNPNDISKDEFVYDQAVRRYGPELAQKASDGFKAFVDAVHNGQTTSEAYYQRRILLRPYGYRSMPRSYSRKTIKKLEKYFEAALPIPEEGKKNKYLQQDIYDALRQYITELTNIHIYGTHDAYMVKSKDFFSKHARAILFLMEQLEKLVSSNKRWHIESEAKKLNGNSCEIPEYYHIKTEDQISRFIRDKGTTFAQYCPSSLLDYPGKDYYELIKYYYKPRVKVYLDYMEKVMENVEEPNTETIENKLKELYRPIETKWVEEGYPTSSDETCQPVWEAVQSVYSAISLNSDVEFHKDSD